MRCTACQSENRDGRRFCAECGTPLAAECAACGFTNEADDKFCGGCGAALSTTRTPTSSDTSGREIGERRQITIMFVDLSGYTQLSESLDAEELHTITGRFLDAVDQLVEAHGGTVHRHVGDEVMALFGTPIAHSDDPYRAVVTALECHTAMTRLSAELNRELTIHIGIASGEVIVAGQGELNPQDVPEYAITGVAANLASRLNGMAAARETIVSGAVYRAVERDVEFDALGEVEVKGLEKPVAAWRATGLRDERSPLMTSDFVGRHTELAQFDGIAGACIETGAGQTILVRGEAGFGKSRLLVEFRSRAEARGFACHRGLILDFGVGKGEDAIASLVASLLGMPPAGDVEGRERAADAAIAAGHVDSSQRVFLNDLLDLPQSITLQADFNAMDNETRATGKLSVVSDLVKYFATQSPLLLTIEDIHWADTTTLNYLARIAGAVQDDACVLVMSSRIEGDPLDQEWRGAASGIPLVTMDLGPLRPQEALQLAAAVGTASEEFTQSCIERAGGSPLFLEQLLRGAEESGHEDIPGSIQSLVLARIDQLPDRDKHALQTAAAIGQRFDLATLRALLNDPDYSCDVLIQHYLIRRDGATCMFAHALILEGVYASLLKARRNEIHCCAAAWFAERDTALRAEHLDRAEDGRAPVAYLEAACEQLAGSRYEQARQLVERGLEIAVTTDDLHRLACAHGEILRDLGEIPASIAAFETALTVSDTDARRGQAHIGLAGSMRMVDRYEDALEQLASAEAAGGGNDPAKAAQIHYLRGNLYFPMGEMEQCRAEHTASLANAHAAGSPELEAKALGGLADAEYASGRMITAADEYRRCIELARENGFGRIAISNGYMVGFSRHYSCELAEALADGEGTVEAAARIGHYRAEILGHNLMFHVLIEWERYDDAMPHIERAQELVKEFDAWRFEPENLNYKSMLIRLRDGRVDEARSLCERSIKIAEETGIRFDGPRCYSQLALCADHEIQQREALKTGEAILDAGAVSHNYFYFYREAMSVARQQGDWDEMDRYATALQSYTAREPLPWSDYFIERGRALARHGRGERSVALNEELKRLLSDGQCYQLKLALPELQAAISEFS